MELIEMMSLKNKKSKLEMVSINHFEFAFFHILLPSFIGFANPLSVVCLETAF